MTLSLSISWLITGKSLCESTSVSPCPGKCLAHAIIPSSCIPLAYAHPFSLTFMGSSPKDR